LGSPDDAKPLAVYRYLTEFLNDPRVIDLPALGRFILVNLIIVPFRFLNSTKLYKQLWTKEGSPLINYGKQLRELVQAEFSGDEVKVYIAMRYGKPSINEVLKEMEKEHFHKLVILPLFPQYASATNGSAIEKSLRLIKEWYVVPDIKIISQFFDHPAYINTFIKIGAGYKPENYDHILFSYHGLPLRQLDKVYEDRNCNNHSCEHEINDENLYCYKATCYATTRLIAAGLGIPESKYTVCFQSRLSNKWMEPFADAVVKEMAKNGTKKLLVFSPAFVSDCLETNIEIGHEYLELFKEHGGEQLQLVESLNIHPDWVKGIRNLIAQELPS
jgi:ferrochelatase